MRLSRIACLAIAIRTAAAASVGCRSSGELSDAGAIGDATQQPERSVGPSDDAANDRSVGPSDDAAEAGIDSPSSPDGASPDEEAPYDARPDVSMTTPPHRPSAASCTLPRPASNATCNHDGGTPCARDQDCTHGVNGRCVCSFTACCGDANVCSYDECTSDLDCADGGGVCACRENPINDWGTQNVCLSAGNCRVDSDCPSGYCSPASLPTGCKGRWYGYFCHTSSDQCLDDGDCVGAGAFCAFDRGAGRWVCSTAVCGGDA
jgi:hypothetical protein